MLRLIADLNPTDPAFGLALEEALLESVKNGGDDILRLWVNDRSVIIGRSQSAKNEVDLDFLRSQSIPVLRRLSGGGTVYHYQGNLNMSLFLKDGRNLGTLKETYATIGRAIVDALSRVGIDAIVEGSVILVNRKKIAGAAQVRHGKSLLYHTTLLIYPSAIPMEDLLLAMQDPYKPALVASKPRPVASLSQVSLGVTLENLVRTLSGAIAQLLGQDVQEGRYTKEELEHASQLESKKYTRDEWNLSR